MKVSKLFLTVVTLMSLVVGFINAHQAPASAQTLPGQIELRGTISAMVGNDLTIAGQRIVRAPLVQVVGNPIVGATAKVEGTLQADGSILATQIVSPSDKLADIQASGNLVSLVGAIGSVTPTMLTLQGKNVVISAQTQIAGTLVVGALAKVEGSFQADGSIMARQIASPPVAAAAPAASSTTKAVFGTVLSKGTDSMTLDTVEGPVNVKIVAASRLHTGTGEPLKLADIRKGDRLAVVTQKQGMILAAQDVMLVPTQTMVQHEVGMVTAEQTFGVTLTKPSGEQVKVLALNGPKFGSVVTMVVRRDPKTADRVSSSWSDMGQVEDRLVGRMKELQSEDARGRAAEIEHLRSVLEDNTARHLGMLHDVRNGMEVEARGRINEAFEDVRGAEAERLRGFGMEPEIEVHGRITSIDSAAGTVTIQPQRGDAITVKITKEIEIHKDNRGKGSLADLKTDDTILAARLDASLKQVVRIEARSPKVQVEDGVLSTVRPDRSSISLLTRDRRDPLTLSIDKSSRITRDGVAVTLDKVGADDIVGQVEFRDGSFQVTSLSVMSRSQAGARPVEFIGAIDSVTPTQITISGQKVATDAMTEFKGAPVVGAIAKAEVTVRPDGSLLAREIYLGQLPGDAASRGEKEHMAFKGVIEAGDDKRLVVAGRTISINKETQFSGKVSAGSTARVEFELQKDGSLVASRVEMGEDLVRGPRDEFQLMGNIVEFNGKIDAIGDDSITISGRSIARSALSEVKGTLSVGATARVQGNIQADGSIVAREIKSPSDRVDEIQTRGNVFEVTGTVNSASATLITVAGQKVVISPQTEVKIAAQTGAVVKVQGFVQPDGSLLAREIQSPQAEFVSGHEAEIRGQEAEARGRETEARGREAEGEAPRGADSPGDDKGGSGGGSGSSGSSGGSGS